MEDIIKKTTGFVVSDKESENILFMPQNTSSPKLTIQEQIEHMKQQGILFNIVSEEEAIEFLKNNNYYFKIKAYKKAYHKIVETDKYVNLDFAYLKELSTIDALFRKIILKICLDIEHFLKVKLLRDCAGNEKENGYDIVKKFLSHFPHCKEEIESKNNNPFIKNLIKSINDNYAIWNIVELLSFGDLSQLIKLYYDSYPDPVMKKIIGCLLPVRCIRNAAAHNNCLLNNILKEKSSLITPSKILVKEVSRIKKISQNVRNKKIENAVLHDFVSMLYVYNHIVTSKTARECTYYELSNVLIRRMYKNFSYFDKNADIQAYFDFIKKIVDFYSDSAYNICVEQN